MKDPSDKIVLSVSPRINQNLAATVDNSEKLVTKTENNKEISKVNINSVKGTATVLDAINTPNTTTSISTTTIKSKGFFGNIWGGLSKIAKIFYNF